MKEKFTYLDLNSTSSSVKPSEVSYSSNYSSTTSSPKIRAIFSCSVPAFLVVFGYFCWFILFPYFRRNWNPRRKMMSYVHIESVTLIIFLLGYRMPCIFHMFTYDNPYMDRHEYSYLVVPICFVTLVIIINAARYYSQRITYPEDFDTEDLLIVEPSEFHEETLDLPNQHRVSRGTRRRIFASGEYLSIEGQEGCKNPNNIPRLEETKSILNYLILFSELSLILVIVNPDTCFPEDPLPRFFLCAVHAGHLASVLHKRIMYDNAERIYIVVVFVVSILAIDFCMFHMYRFHESTKVGINVAFEIIFGAIALYIAIWKILLRYTPTKSELIRTISTCLPYLALTICTVTVGMKKLKIGESLSKCA